MTKKEVVQENYDTDKEGPLRHAEFAWSGCQLQNWNPPGYFNRNSMTILQRAYSGCGPSDTVLNPCLR